MKLKTLGVVGRDWLVALAIVFVLWLVWARLAAPSTPTGGPVPPFSLQTLTGETVTHDTHEDVVVLNFWFTSCPPCRSEIPELTRWHEAHPQIPMYGISIDQMPARRLAVLSEKLGVGYPVLHDVDKTVARQFGVSVYPTTIVLHEGQVAAVRIGTLDADSLSRLVEEVH